MHRMRNTEQIDRCRRQLEAFVGERTRQLSDAKLAAEAANAAKSAFLANMSHEIRTPLAAIIGMAGLIRRSHITPRQADWLGKLEAAGNHLLDLINGVLDLSKIDAGKLVLEDAPVDIERIAADVVSMLSERAAAKGLCLSIEMQNVPTGLLGDSTRLQQAWLNYAGNAIKFTQSGSVMLRISCDDDAAEDALLRFEVQDTGIGIAAATLPRLFTAFEQGDKSTYRGFGGTGLGLAIAHQLAQLMGGSAGVASTLGVGSCFWFTARLRKVERLDPAVEQSTAEARLALEFPGARFLLVDDEPINREVTQELLAGLIAQVDVADDGLEAVRLASKHRYDLILMDVQMPGMDGLEATRLIRALPGGAQTRIVALTASAYSDDKALCLAAGMDGFLAKPFNVETLFDTVVHALSH
jgi:CheY-like chemotaxis protein